MNFYDISDLERISGIKSHTIRMWEKRYNLLNPHRTSTNIRRYTDDDLRKLLNVRTLLDVGWKISKIASCTEKDIIRSIQKIFEEKHQAEHFYYQYFINELIYYGVVFNEENFERMYLTAVNRFGIMDTIKHIIYPLLRKVGLMWEINEIIPAQEHFITNIIRKKLITAVDAIPFPQKVKDSFVLFLPPKEYHEIPLILSDLVLRQKRIQTFYLGADVPLENVVTTAISQKVTQFLTIITTTHDEQDLINLRVRMIECFKKVKKYHIFIGGNAEVKAVFKNFSHFTFMDNFNFLLNF